MATRICVPAPVNLYSTYGYMTIQMHEPSETYFVGKHYGKENRHKSKTDYPVLTHYHDRYGDNALASAEAEIERKGMTDNASEPRKGRAERAAEESAEKQDREHSLSRIADKGQNSGRLTVGTSILVMPPFPEPCLRTSSR